MRYCSLVSLSRIASAAEQISCESYDLILLDLNLPDTDGIEILRHLRSFDNETGVLIMSARSQIADKVEGLDEEANDYIVKPFHLDELKARIRSLTRRSFIQNDINIACGKLCFNTKSRTAYAEGRGITLTRKETGILEYLMLNQGRPVSQEELIEHVWDGSVDNFSNSVRVHMSSLRKKLKAELAYDPICNRIGEGYQIGDEKRKNCRYNGA
jgi:two-component system, OmpR family, response regulator